MKKEIEISCVKGSNDHSTERVILDVIEDCDIGEFFIMDTTYTSDEKVSNKVRHPYWFPDMKVKKGDKIVLYTKPGKQSSKKITDKNYSVHFFYWGLASSVWNNDQDCILLVKQSWFSYKKVK